MRFLWLVVLMGGCSAGNQVCVDMRWRNKDGSQLVERATFPSWSQARSYVEGVDRNGLTQLSVHECFDFR